jgi:glycosyltransferase involved in cell wall biosynthesis
MRICMISPFGFQAATTRVRAYNLAKNLAPQGDEVLLLTSGEVSPISPSRDVKIVSVYRQEKTAPDFLIAMLKKYLTLRRVGKFDLCHIFKSLPWSSLPALFVRGKGRLVVDLDDWETGTVIDRGLYFQVPLVSFFERWVPRLCDGVIVVSEFLKKMCIQNGVDEERILVLPYGCDIENFYPMPKDELLLKKYGLEGKLVVYTGSMTELNLRILIEAMKLVTREVKDVVLLIVSPERDLLEFRQHLIKLGLAPENFLVLERQPHHKMPRVISLADVVYVPKRFLPVDEACSPSRLGEYLASGKPIVANAVGVVKEQLSDAGLLVYSYNPRELAEKIMMLLLDKRLAKKLGEKAREKAISLSWARLAKRLREFYQKIL